jgi:pimeloyl-ACP methyl ester carboxylesterase
VTVQAVEDVRLDRVQARSAQDKSQTGGRRYRPRRPVPLVDVPTIVFHSIHDKLVPFDQGRRLAASIPNARFVPLDRENHALLADEPAWTKFVDEMEAFLSDGS